MSRRNGRRVSAFFLSGGLPITAGLQLDLNAAKGITLNVSNVSAWADQSGVDVNHNTAQGTGALQPAFNASNASYAGAPTVTFSGSQILPTGTWSTPIAPPITLYAVAHTTSGAGGNGLVNGTSKFTTTDSFGTGVHVDDGTTGLTASVGTLNTPSVICCVANAASSAIYLSAKTAKSSGTVATNTADSVFAIGNFGGGGANSWNGPIARILMYGAGHNAAQVATMLTYLGGLYGVAIGA